MSRIAISLAVAMTVTGCSSDDSAGDAAAAECKPQVRLAGVTYSASGYTERDASKHLPADEAECHDSGAKPVGSVFPESPEQVTTWTFHGYPPDEVLGVRFQRDSFTVLIADSIAADERDRIERALS